MHARLQNPSNSVSSLEEKIAKEVAAAILAGFNRHYALFRHCAQKAKNMYESGDWKAIQQLSRDRIAYYDNRVNECVQYLQQMFVAEKLSDEVWAAVKRYYVTELIDHKQPECAETFFNSVCCQILHRDYFHNAFIFVRPAVATDHMDSDPPSFRAYYPSSEGLRASSLRLFEDFALACPYVDIRRDVRWLLRSALKALRSLRRHQWHIEADCQLQVLSHLFFRNKTAYIIGKFINAGIPRPFAVPLLRNAAGKVYADTLLFSQDEMSKLFSFTRAYFLVDMDTPAAYVAFLRDLLPNRSKAELYTMLGLQKQGKTLFYRDFLHHLKHSHDKLCIAPGIKGMVMSVFTLPSYPYVFKIIKEKMQKELTREFVKEKYQLVKQHDRVGRMADTWEFSDVALPRSRVAQEVIDELLALAPSILEMQGDTVVLRHVYIERRMRPLNIHLMHASDAELERAIKDYGNAIKELASANIFPGDMLYKNFGVTRLGRVVFYDYDEIQYMTEMNFRSIPQARTEEEELSDTPWYPVGKNDVFPEEFERFLLGDSRVKAAFLKHHADLLAAQWWKTIQTHIQAGHIEDAFSYERDRRFLNIFLK